MIFRWDELIFDETLNLNGNKRERFWNIKNLGKKETKSVRIKPAVWDY